MALACSYWQVAQAAGQVKILIFIVKIKFFPMYANICCEAGQVPILRYFEAFQNQYEVIVPLFVVVACPQALYYLLFKLKVL